MLNLGRATKMRFGYQADSVTAATTGWVLPPFYGVTPPGDPGIQDDPILGGALYNGRDPGEGVRELEGGQLQLSVPFDLNMLGHWLRQGFGAGVESGSSPNYVHTFVSGLATLPYVTIEILYTSGYVARHEGCMLNLFGRGMRKEAAFGRLDLTYLTRRTIIASAFIAGGSAASVLTELKVPQVRGKAQWGGADMGDLLELSFAYNNNCEAYNTMSGDAYPLEIDPGFTTINGSFRLRLRDKTFRDLSVANSIDALKPIVTHASDATNRRFEFGVNYARIASQGAPINGPGAIDESFSFQGEQGVGPAVTAVLKNGVAGSVYGYA